MILIVDDDPSVTASLELLLKRQGHASLSAAGPDEALKLLGARDIDLVLQDMNFSRDTSGREGLELLRRIRSGHPGVPVVLITAWGSIELAVEGIKAGASDFLTKPWTNNHLMQAVETVLSLRGRGGTTEREEAPARAELDSQYDLDGLVGEDPAFLRVLDLVGRVAATDASVLITGESGTGKELVAEAIHRNSGRRDRRFVKVNLGGISSTLFESEMFGHVRGAFTGAAADRKGRFEVADGGTIFLDEIGELDASSQVKLLRVLQDRTYEVLGSSATRRVDVRVVSATNRDLSRAVAEGHFREDLLYRLNLISVRLPALRERRGDIPLLARALLAQSGASYGRDSLELEPAAVAWLQDRPWPGNVRQLRQTLERAALVSEDRRIGADELARLEDLTSADRSPDDLPRAGAMTLDEMERGMIVKCLARYQGNLTRVAEALGLSRAALYRRLDKYGLH